MRFAEARWPLLILDVLVASFLRNIINMTSPYIMTSLCILDGRSAFDRLSSA